MHYVVSDDCISIYTIVINLSLKSHCCLDSLLKQVTSIPNILWVCNS